MTQLFGSSAEQVDRIRPLFPKERGVKRVDDRKVLSGIIPVIQKGLRWVDAGRLWSPDWPHQGGQPASSMGSATAEVVPDGFTCVGGNAVTSLVLMCCSRTCCLRPGDWGSRL